MYNTSKLSPQTLEFIQKLSAQATTNREVVPMALSRAIAAKLPLPSGELLTPAEYYATDVTPATRELISTFSDIIAVDCDRCLELVRTFWLIRYKSAFPSATVFACCDIPTESSFLGYGSTLSSPDIKFIQDNTIALCIHFNGFAKMIQDIYVPATPEVQQTAGV